MGKQQRSRDDGKVAPLNGLHPTTTVASNTPPAAPRAAMLAAPETVVDTEQPPAPNYPRFRIEPGEQLKLAVPETTTQFKLVQIDPDESEQYESKKDVAAELERQRDRITDLQARLYAEHQQSLLIVLQAMDTGGKDGTIKHVLRGVNPQGCEVHSFKAPSPEEQDHDFLWRYHMQAPRKGMITIFNRSHYEDVLITRVKHMVDEQEWRRRYELINQFEHLLTLNRTTILKFFLYISKDEQKRRLESRLADPTKHWKFSTNDLKERTYWNEYLLAFEDAINHCATDYAPWYVVPANKKWYRNLVVARTIADTLEAMNPQYPEAEVGLEHVVVPD